MDYGINNTSGKPDNKEAFAILDTAWDSGITKLDTAMSYGDAHAIIGQWHRKNPGKRFDVISKFSTQPSARSLNEEISILLDTLAVDRLFALLHHRPGEIKADAPVLKKMRQLVETAHTRFTGVSVYTNADIKTFSTIPEIDIIQLPFNALDNINQRGIPIKTAYKSGKIIHARSVFLQGLFFKPTSTFSQQLQPLAKHIDVLTALAVKYGTSVQSLALGYVFSQPEIEGVLIGVESVKQLASNLRSLEQPTSQTINSLIDEIVVREFELLNPASWLQI